MWWESRRKRRGLMKMSLWAPVHGFHSWPKCQLFILQILTYSLFIDNIDCALLITAVCRCLASQLQSKKLWHYMSTSCVKIPQPRKSGFYGFLFHPFALGVNTLVIGDCPKVWIARMLSLVFRNRLRKWVIVDIIMNLLQGRCKQTEVQ